MKFLNQLGIGTLSRRTAWVGSAKTLTILSFIAANIYLTRRLSVSDFGRYQQVWLIIRTLTPIFLLGIPQALNYFIPQTDRKTGRSYLTVFNLILLCMGIIIAAVSYLKPEAITLIAGNREIVPLVSIAGLYLLFILPSNLLEPVLIFQKKVREYFLWNLSFTVIFICIVFYGGYIDDLEWIFQGLAGLAFFKALVALIRSQTTLGMGNPGHISDRKKHLFRYLLVLGSIGFVDILTAHMDKYLVSHFTGEEKFAIYSIGSIEIPLAGLLLSAVTAVVMPEFSRLIAQKKHSQVLSLLKRSMEKLAVFIFPVFIYSMLTAHFFIPFFFSEKYMDSIPIFIIYLVMLPMRAINNHPYLIAAGLQRYALYARIIDIIINFVLGIILLKWVGIAGPAVSTVLASYVHKAYQTGIVCKNLDVSLKRIYPWRGLMRIFTVSAVSGLPLFLLLLQGKDLTAIPLVIGSVIFIGIYMAFTPWILRRAGRD